MVMLIIEHAQAPLQNLRGKTGVSNPHQIPCDRNLPDFNIPKPLKTPKWKREKNQDNRKMALKGRQKNRGRRR